MSGRKAPATERKRLRTTDRSDPERRPMKQSLAHLAANATAAGGARLRPGQGNCAYPWHVGESTRARDFAGMTVVITESKLHFRWPGDPSS